MQSPGEPPLDATVCICTWNRSHSLDRALRSVGELRIPSGLRWETLVVDNGSDDDTAAVLSRHAGRLPLRVVHEPLPGVGNARVRGLAAARGRLIAWTDDDVEVDPGWLASIVNASVRYTDAAFWGGRIDVCFESPPPEWVVRAWPVVASVYGERRLGDKPVEILELRQYPFGANFATRAEVLRRHPFDAALGRCRDRYVGGEETSAIQAMLLNGHRGWWLPDAKVVHWIAPEGGSLEYLGRYWRGAGAKDADHHGSLARTLAALVRAHVMLGRYRFQRMTRPAEHWIEAYLRAEYQRGRLSAPTGRGWMRRLTGAPRRKSNR